jgi:hypothetical protein
MQRARGSADAAAAAAAAAKVAPLLQLKRAAKKADKLARFSRAVELCERALAAAELALPRDSLIIAALRNNELSAKQNRAAQAIPSSSAAAVRMALIPRMLHQLHARWQAGTLFSPTAEEVAYLAEDEYPYVPAQMCGAYFYIATAMEVVHDEVVGGLLPCTPAEAEARLQVRYGALRTALETDARGMLERNPRTGQAWSASSTASDEVKTKMSSSVFFLKTAVHRLVTLALSDEAGLVLPMRVTCGLIDAEVTALRQLAERHKAEGERFEQGLVNQREKANMMTQQAAAADTARHGLRRCALPACDAQEPHPKLFKLCGRCRGAAYCCAAHSAGDWKRHKREDGCAAPP